VPIVNTLAFLFTVVGDWWVESKVISRGMFLSHVLGGLLADGNRNDGGHGLVAFGDCAVRA
jgi:hypothetical protein